MSLAPSTKLPSDWPGEELDLAVHDRPHSSSMIEWWYFNAHLRGMDGHRFAMFASFFRCVVDFERETGEPKYGHILTWSLMDMEKKRYLSTSRLEDSMRHYMIERLKRGEVYQDARIRKAVQEILAKGDVPKPDRMFASPAICLTDTLHCEFGGSRLRREDDGSYSLHLEGDEASCSLRFEPAKEPARHGENGVTKGLRGEDMFYYFISRNNVFGTVTVDGKDVEVTGNGWYDHEFGGNRWEEGKAPEAQLAMAWNWCSAQLDDGSEFTVLLRKEVKSNRGWPMAVLVRKDGTSVSSSSVRFEPKRWWRSMKTFESYPVAWELEAPALGVKLSVETDFFDQEFITLVSKTAFWEGEMAVAGSMGGRSVRGLAFVERQGFEMMHHLDEFFATVSKEVIKLVDEIMPRKPHRKLAISLFAHQMRPYLLDDVDIDQLSDGLIRPVREITDRGGKAWRSYAFLACCEAVGGDSRRFYRWLAIPELIHAGALIIDDFEDKSDRRRGGPTVHMLYGDNVAINAGTNAYFSIHRIVSTSDLSESDKLKMYDLYFEAMRESHAGQALDLIGFRRLADVAVATGEAAALEKSVMAMYRLKTSSAAACLARMGAIAGGGTQEQIIALGKYFETLGVAFQMVDDVLNLRGFEGKLKTVGDDVTAGKVTLPVAKALGRLAADERAELLKLIRLESSDPEMVGRAISIIEGCGALESCMKDAYALVEIAWARLDPAIEPSIPKVMLRAFGWYLLERHY